MPNGFPWHRGSSKFSKYWPLSQTQQNLCQPLTESLLTTWQVLLFDSMKLYLKLTYAKYLFINPLWLEVIAILKNTGYGTTRQFSPESPNWMLGGLFKYPFWFARYSTLYHRLPILLISCPFSTSLSMSVYLLWSDGQKWTLSLFGFLHGIDCLCKLWHLLHVLVIGKWFFSLRQSCNPK